MLAIFQASIHLMSRVSWVAVVMVRTTMVGSMVVWPMVGSMVVWPMVMWPMVGSMVVAMVMVTMGSTAISSKAVMVTMMVVMGCCARSHFSVMGVLSQMMLMVGFALWKEKQNFLLRTIGMMHWIDLLFTGYQPHQTINISIDTDRLIRYNRRNNRLDQKQQICKPILSFEVCYHLMPLR